MTKMNIIYDHWNHDHRITIIGNDFFIAGVVLRYLLEVTSSSP
jgi:hypothetical protein